MALLRSKLYPKRSKFILNTLKEKGLYEESIILFSSDNGSYRLASNGGLKAVKSYTYEGGIRVPGILRWPGLNQPGSTTDEALGFVDVVPTLYEGLGLAKEEAEKAKKKAEEDAKKEIKKLFGK